MMQYYSSKHKIQHKTAAAHKKKYTANLINSAHMPSFHKSLCFFCDIKSGIRCVEHNCPHPTPHRISAIKWIELWRASPYHPLLTTTPRACLQPLYRQAPPRTSGIRDRCGWLARIPFLLNTPGTPSPIPSSIVHQLT
jgi:hypothetical protein